LFADNSSSSSSLLRLVLLGVYRQFFIFFIAAEPRILYRLHHQQAACRVDEKEAAASYVSRSCAHGFSRTSHVAHFSVVLLIFSVVFIAKNWRNDDAFLAKER
jgi:hypothetical protein